MLKNVPLGLGGSGGREATDAGARDAAPVEEGDANLGAPDQATETRGTTDGPEPSAYTVTPTLTLTNALEALAVANNNTRVGVIYSDGSERHLVELNATGSPTSGPTEVADAIYYNELSIGIADAGFMGAFSNHALLGQWQVYVAGIGAGGPAAREARVSQGAGEAMAPVVQRAGTRWAMSWRDGQDLGFALLNDNGVVERRSVISTLGVFPFPDRILHGADGFHVLIRGDNERAVEHFTGAGAHVRTGPTFTGAAADAAFLDNQLAVVVAQGMTLSLRRFQPDTDTAIGAPREVYAGSSSITLVRLAESSAGAGLVWIESGGTRSLWFAALLPGDVLSPPRRISAPASDVSEARLAATNAGFVAVWIEASPSAALQTAFIAP